jgi:hypothetical protein
VKDKKKVPCEMESTSLVGTAFSQPLPSISLNPSRVICLKQIQPDRYRNNLYLNDTGLPQQGHTPALDDSAHPPPSPFPGVENQFKLGPSDRVSSPLTAESGCSPEARLLSFLQTGTSERRPSPGSTTCGRLDGFGIASNI